MNNNDDNFDNHGNIGEKMKGKMMKMIIRISQLINNDQK